MEETEKITEAKEWESKGRWAVLQAVGTQGIVWK